jgi:pimeloyl-ACP methyl ester carboxylesterase
VLSYDQRGTGESTGAWRNDGIERMAEDMADAARLIQQRDKLDMVGFFGFSNGGWVAPAAAVKFGTPGFVVIKSGDSQSVEDNVLFETATAVTAHAGLTAGQHARAIMERLFQALHTDSDVDWAEAKRALEGVREETWLKYTQLPPPAALPLTSDQKEGFRRQLFFDPKNYLLKLACPVLVLLGELDVDVDAPKSAALYRKYFAESHNQRTTVLLLKSAGHQLIKGPGPSANNSMETGRYANGYPKAMTQWLTNRDGERQ